MMRSSPYEVQPMPIQGDGRPDVSKVPHHFTGATFDSRKIKQPHTVWVDGKIVCFTTTGKNALSVLRNELNRKHSHPRGAIRVQ